MNFSRAYYLPWNRLSWARIGRRRTGQVRTLSDCRNVLWSVTCIGKSASCHLICTCHRIDKDLDYTTQPSHQLSRSASACNLYLFDRNQNKQCQFAVPKLISMSFTRLNPNGRIEQARWAVNWTLSYVNCVEIWCYENNRSWFLFAFRDLCGLCCRFRST